MAHLNMLEAAVLREMCKQVPEDAVALGLQIDEAVVVSRDNTGAGFYSNLKVVGAAGSVKSKIIANVFARIDGLKNPMSFALFIKEGVINVLEGAAVDDSTVGLDFSKVKFRLSSGG